MLQQPVELRLECRIVARLEVGALQLLDRLDQRLGNIAAAELSEVAARVRVAPRDDWCHEIASNNARIRP